MNFETDPWDTDKLNVTILVRDSQRITNFLNLMETQRTEDPVGDLLDLTVYMKVKRRSGAAYSGFVSPAADYYRSHEE